MKVQLIRLSCLGPLAFFLQKTFNSEVVYSRNGSWAQIQINCIYVCISESKLNKYDSVLSTLTLIMHIIYKLTNRKIERQRKPKNNQEWKIQRHWQQLGTHDTWLRQITQYRKIKRGAIRTSHKKKNGMKLDVRER